MATNKKFLYFANAYWDKNEPLLHYMHEIWKRWNILERESQNWITICGFASSPRKVATHSFQIDNSEGVQFVGRWKQTSRARYDGFVGGFALIFKVRTKGSLVITWSSWLEFKGLLQDSLRTSLRGRYQVCHAVITRFVTRFTPTGFWPFCTDFQWRGSFRSFGWLF